MGRASDLGNGFINTCMNAKRQTITGSVNLLDQLWELVTVVTHHMQHRTKDLFLQFGKVIQFDQRRGDKGATLPFAGIFTVFPHRLEHRTAFTTHSLNMALNIGLRFAINHRTDIGGQATRITHPAFGHCAAQHFQRVVGNLILQAQHAQCRTTLTRTVEGRGQYIHDDLFGQGGGIDNHRVHAAGFRNEWNWAALSVQAAGDIALQ